LHFRSGVNFFAGAGNKKDNYREAGAKASSKPLVEVIKRAKITNEKE
jgi:hypothetical protein